MVDRRERERPEAGLAPRSVALRLLERVEEEGTFVGRAHAPACDRANLTGPDRALVLTLVQACLRRQAALDGLIKKLTKGPIDVPVRRVLRLGLTQLLLLERIPDHAAVSTSVALVRSAGKPRAAGLVNAVLRRVTRERQEWVDALDPQRCPLGWLGPAPRWLIGRWNERLGPAEARTLQASLGSTPSVDLRIDSGEPSAWAEELGGTVLAGSPKRLQLDRADRIADRPGFAAGAWSVQDRNAARVVEQFPPGGQSGIDLCAAPGGKTVQMAHRMGGGSLLAVDLHAHRAKLIEQATARCGVVAEVLVGDAREVLVERPGPYDRILLDAPCSGLGTLRRHPEIALRSRAEQLADHHRRQAELLGCALDRLAVGGILVYAVCSTEPEEGAEVVAELLAGRSDIALSVTEELLDGTATWGEDGDGDGFFVARIERVLEAKK
jgi:16S rRNA (cytosine967-C5)-methyltransferase